ncbi:competence type IV pilus ATPase ComGA [Evansella cellulosilytica]|uniref:Type II secretion system protein E n=1 Tax=Evansella cellulosilytica (strain ATCC 21833 / DSM 2522 / FERM P-1141 / JCM 9156 / N-4) TaxID=649639 RepID=E6TWY7_EVAC2|nr:competence type IV pilus ATPase ComGA [Evansella cellulosilytica]ADU29937.1 type II secretion system protein E [Evansella cellulosilytica DSM 2522]
MDVERKTKALLLNALSYTASDVHFIPMKKNGLVRYRIDGKLVDMETLPLNLLQRIISYLKFISGMDIGEKRRPQTSSLEIPLLNKLYAMRLSTFPSTSYETLVIRLFPLKDHQTLHQLSLFPGQAKKILNLIQAPSGLIIICGPTGSGKTTTLYSLLHTCSFNLKRNIITLEDPIEQKHDHFLQMEINERAGVTYSVGLRSLLRHDPDVIMLGEIRDSETAQMAIRASLTGHLVFSTLHSKCTKTALNRLLELGVRQVDLQETVTAIIAQRLVDVVCPYCGMSCHSHCKKRRLRRRAAIYEILEGEIVQYMHELPGAKKIKTLNELISKSIALGFVHEYEYFRFGKGGIGD